MDLDCLYAVMLSPYESVGEIKREKYLSIDERCAGKEFAYLWPVVSSHTPLACWHQAFDLCQKIATKKRAAIFVGSSLIPMPSMSSAGVFGN